MSVWTRHLSWTFVDWAEHKFSSASAPELLERFAAKHGYEPDEIENVFRQEEAEHEAKECQAPGCVREFKAERAEAKLHKIGSHKTNGTRLKAAPERPSSLPLLDHLK